MATTKKTGASKFTLPKTVPVKCQGFVDDDKVQKFAEGHQDYRLVSKADAHQVTRCVACQKASQKVGQAERRAKSSAKKAEKRAAEAKTNAETLIANKAIFGNLSKADQAYLKSLVG